MSNTFYPKGTKLKCIKANTNITEGKIYTIVGYDDDNCDMYDGCYIINDKGEEAWRFYTRFTKVTSKYLTRIEK